MTRKKFIQQLSKTTVLLIFGGSLFAYDFTKNKSNKKDKGALFAHSLDTKFHLN